MFDVRPVETDYVRQRAAEFRAQVARRLDGSLTEDEFTYILTTFPLVEEAVKAATLDAYRSFAPDPTDLQLAEMIQRGEIARLEFKVAACWNPATGAKDGTLRDNIVQGVAAFLNSKEGGALVIRGERRREQREGDDAWFRSETTYGSFERRIAVPESLEDADITASYVDGVLEVVVPKAVEQQQPKRIPVVAGTKQKALEGTAHKS